MNYHCVQVLLADKRNGKKVGCFPTQYSSLCKQNCSPKKSNFLLCLHSWQPLFGISQLSSRELNVRSAATLKQAYVKGNWLKSQNSPKFSRVPQNSSTKSNFLLYLHSWQLLFDISQLSSRELNVRFVATPMQAHVKMGLVQNLKSPKAVVIQHKIILFIPGF